MECPHCQKTLDLPGHATGNVRRYNTPATVATLCCGMPVRLTPVITVSVNLVANPGNTDDWGTPYTKKVKSKMKT